MTTEAIEPDKPRATIATRRRFETFRRAVEESDLDAIASCYDEEVELFTWSERSRPASAQAEHGREAARRVWGTSIERRLRHVVDEEVIGDDRFAFRVVCHYPTGEKVIGCYLCDLRDGRIARQAGVECWDT